MMVQTPNYTMAKKKLQTIHWPKKNSKLYKLKVRHKREHAEEYTKDALFYFF